MSSSVAINRRISRDSGSGNTSDMNNSKILVIMKLKFLVEPQFNNITKY